MIDSFAPSVIPAEDEALRGPVREFVRSYTAAIAPEIRARSWMGFDAGFSRELAKRGWIGLTLPSEYGGGGRGFFARFVVVEELLAAGAPVGAHWIADRQSGPLIAKYGTEAQKRRYLPAICRAEAFFAVGMSEPSSGSDLASVITRAARTDRGWRLTGRKVWTTHAQHSHFAIVLARTSGTAADRHKGLSQLIVDLSLPGVRIRPIVDIAGDAHFVEIVFDEVDLQSDALIGQEGAGWEQVTAELVYERSGPERLYSSIVLLEQWLKHLRREGAGPAADAASAALAGHFAVQLCALREMSIAVTGLLTRGQDPAAVAALVKDLGTEFEQSIPALIADSVSRFPHCAQDAALVRTLDYVSRIAPTYSLRGGTREILRGMVARGLGLR